MLDNFDLAALDQCLLDYVKIEHDLRQPIPEFRSDAGLIFINVVMNGLFEVKRNRIKLILACESILEGSRYFTKKSKSIAGYVYDFAVSGVTVRVLTYGGLTYGQVFVVRPK